MDEKRRKTFKLFDRFVLGNNNAISKPEVSNEVSYSVLANFVLVRVSSWIVSFCRRKYDPRIHTK